MQDPLQICETFAPALPLLRMTLQRWKMGKSAPECSAALTHIWMFCLSKTLTQIANDKRDPIFEENYRAAFGKNISTTFDNQETANHDLAWNEAIQLIENACHRMQSNKFQVLENIANRAGAPRPPRENEQIVTKALSETIEIAAILEACLLKRVSDWSEITNSAQLKAA